MAGTLFIVATPIGNLEDLTFRALRTLKEVDLIAAEDTRRTARLLAHYEIRRPMTSYHEHNQHRETPRLIGRLAAGQSIALVSDAGTPGIADPGEHLVSAARVAGIKVSPIPGPSAVTAALSISGFPAAEFVFLGFLPRSGTERTRWFERLAAEHRTAVFFEAPHRIEKLMVDLGSFIKRPILIHKELSKIHELSVESPNMSTGGDVRIAGEYVVVVRSAEVGDTGRTDHAADIQSAITLFDCMTNNCDYQEGPAVNACAAAYSVKPLALKKALKQHRIARKRAAERLS